MARIRTAAGALCGDPHICPARSSIGWAEPLMTTIATINKTNIIARRMFRQGKSCPKDFSWGGDRCSRSRAMGLFYSQF